MNKLYPIIRRHRRPLTVADEPAPIVVPVTAVVPLLEPVPVTVIAPAPKPPKPRRAKTVPPSDAK